MNCWDTSTQQGRQDFRSQGCFDAGITGQDGASCAEILLCNGYEVHGIK